jgi:predicted DNA-binding protein (MmcQ/YjbR family)
MHIDELREYCLAKPGVEETFPFDQNTLVMKVMGKMFLAFNVDGYTSFNAKCDPERAIELREQYPDDVLPGYHMSKVHWNTVIAHGVVPDDLQRALVDHSYDLVVVGLTGKLKKELSEISSRATG